MKFGLFYEHQAPGEVVPENDKRILDDALAELEFADKLGYDYVWVVEHHFLEEYSHSSAPEVFLGAVSQRTKRMRLGRGICVMPPKINHPARVAEQLATLDALSGGRVDWGTGESGTAMEIEGFGVELKDKKDAWREATEQCANMLAMTPYPGYEGKFFSMPVRNIVPKPIQRPHPPLWVACSRRDTILRAAENGMGALVFGFAEPEQAGAWVEEYYDIIKSERCVPIGHAVNANFAIVTGMSVHRDEKEAIRRGEQGFKFFGYSLGYYGAFSSHTPGDSKVWESFLPLEASIPQNPGNGGIGTPEQVYQHCKAYQDVGVDQMIFVQQTGNASHQNILESLQLFAEECMPRLKINEEEREAKKLAELQPYFDAAVARKPKMKALEKGSIPEVKAWAVRAKEAAVKSGIEVPGVTNNAGGGAGGAFADRGGGFKIITELPADAKK